MDQKDLAHDLVQRMLDADVHPDSVDELLAKVKYDFIVQNTRETRSAVAGAMTLNTQPNENISQLKEDIAILKDSLGEFANDADTKKRLETLLERFSQGNESHAKNTFQVLFEEIYRTLDTGEKNAKFKEITRAFSVFASKYGMRVWIPQEFEPQMIGDTLVVSEKGNRRGESFDCVERPALFDGQRVRVSAKVILK